MQPMAKKGKGGIYSVRPFEAFVICVGRTVVWDLSLLFKSILYGAPCERCYPPLQVENRIPGRAEGSVAQRREPSFPKAESIQPSVPKRCCWEPLCFKPYFSQVHDLTRKWISSALASHKCCDLSLEMVRLQ